MAHPFLQAKHFTPTDGRAIDLIVIHTMEAPEKGNTAENVAEFFRHPEKPVSAHYCIDNNSVVQCVRDKDVAFAAPGANRNGLQFEHAGFSRQNTTDWHDAFSVAMLALSAALAAEKAAQFNIPIQWLSPEDLLQRKRGFTSHNNVTIAFKKSTHTDPGPSFPHEEYLDTIRAHMGQPTGGSNVAPTGPIVVGHPLLKKGVKGEEAAIRHLQRLLGGLKVDGDFGRITEARVKDIQVRARLFEPSKATGECDAHTWAQIHPVLRRGDSGIAVQELQAALTGLTADGDFGRKTESIVKEFQQKHKLHASGIVLPEMWQILLE